MSKRCPARYRKTSWSSYNASLRKRGSLLIWVDKDMTCARRVSVGLSDLRCFRMRQEGRRGQTIRYPSRTNRLE